MPVKYKGILETIFGIYKGKFECQKDIHFKTHPGLTSVAQSVERWSRDPGSRVQFPAGGLGVAFFATGPGWVLKCLFF